MAILKTKEAFNIIYKDVKWSSEKSREDAFCYFEQGALSQSSPPVKEGSHKQMASLILDYLNDSRKLISKNKKVRGFKITDSIQRMIQARLKEGYSIDDFKQIVDYKCHEWKGTVFEKYLQPSTLFGPKHFPEYLVEAESFKKPELSALDKQISGLME